MIDDPSVRSAELPPPFREDPFYRICIRDCTGAFLLLLSLSSNLKRVGGEKFQHPTLFRFPLTDRGGIPGEGFSHG